MLQPTSPLRKASDVIKCIKIFKNKKLMSLATISKIKVNTSELINEKSKKLKFIFGKKLRQSGRNCYFIDGSIYINSIKFLKKYKSLMIEGKTNLVKLNDNFTVDIDFGHDLVLANYFLRKKFMINKKNKQKRIHDSIYLTKKPLIKESFKFLLNEIQKVVKILIAS